MQVFLSYGHDQTKELVCEIKRYLEDRQIDGQSHYVWVDQFEIKPCDDWRYDITEGIISKSEFFLAFLSKYSVREPGVCRDEIALAVAVKGGNILSILVESEKKVKIPVNISHIQWLDMSDWEEKWDIGGDVWLKYRKEKFDQIAEIVESEESRRFTGEIEQLRKTLVPIRFDARIKDLVKKGFVGREWLFDTVEEWRERPGDSRILGIIGSPGVGKSAFAAQLTRIPNHNVIAAHFVDCQNSDSNDPFRVICNIAFQLATRLPDYRKFLLSSVRLDYPDLKSKSISALFSFLLVEPLHLAIHGERDHYLIVIDALDEATKNGSNSLVPMLAMYAKLLPSWLNFVVTSRFESDIKLHLHALNPTVLDTQTESNRKDIRIYIKEQLKGDIENWPNSSRLIEQILEKSEGVFLYIERFCTDVKKGYLSLDRPDEFPQGFGGMLAQWFERQFPDRERYDDEICPALGVILAAQESLPLDMLQKIFQWNKKKSLNFADSLGSLFTVDSNGKQETIKAYHKSIADWLTDLSKSRCYYVDLEDAHRQLADFCWSVYQENELPTCPYAVKHLPAHLIASERWDDLEVHLTDLSFLEAKTAAGFVFDLADDFKKAVNALSSERPMRRILKLLEEALRRDIHFIARHAEDYPQALFQCLWNTCWWYDCPQAADYYVEPEGGWNERNAPWLATNTPRLYELLEKWHEQKCKESPSQQWLCSHRPPSLLLGSAQIAVLRGHGEWVVSVDFSPLNDRFLASSSHDKTVRLWDTKTGNELAIFEGHNHCVKHVIFSPNGRYLASASYDGTVRIWDAKTEKEHHVLKGHNDSVTHVAFSPKGHILASASEDKTIRLWDIETGNELAIFNGHTDSVTHVVFSPSDGHILGSASQDKTVRLWNIETRKEIHILEGHDDWVNHIAFCPDGCCLASASLDKTVRLWNPQTGEPIDIFDGHDDFAYRVAFSPNNHRLACASGDKTVRVWDTKTKKTHLNLKGHDDWVKDVVFNPLDSQLLATASEDRTVRLWNMADGSTSNVLGWHDDCATSVCFSPDGRYLASSSRDKTVRLWDIESAHGIPVLKGHRKLVNCIALSSDGRHLASASWDDTTRLWNAETGKELMLLNGHTSWVTHIAFSPNGRWLATASDDKAVCLWDMENLLAPTVLEGHVGNFSRVVFSPDSSRLASVSWDDTIRLWDVETQNELASIKEDMTLCTFVTFCQNNHHIAVANWDKSILHIWDMDTKNRTEIIDDPSAINAIFCAAPNSLFALAATGWETMICRTENDMTVAWFSSFIDKAIAHRNGYTWSGRTGCHLAVFSLCDFSSKESLPSHMR